FLPSNSQENVKQDPRGLQTFVELEGTYYPELEDTYYPKLEGTYYPKLIWTMVACIKYEGQRAFSSNFESLANFDEMYAYRNALRHLIL
ncbi:hypothetical protein CR513_30154, partial [Mucuna pruriens]